MAYSEDQLAQLWIKAGGPPKVAAMMAKIALRESGGKAHINNAGLNKNGSVDYGLWQINSVHGYDPQKLYDPVFNAKAAVAVYKSQGPKAWATYNPAVDAKYIGKEAQARSKIVSHALKPAQASTSPGVDRSQLALSLLGFGNSPNDPLDPIALALQAAQNAKHAASPKSATVESSPASTVTPHGGSVTFDGKPVAQWIAPILKQARATGLWKGTVTSGVRTKAQQLAAARNYGLQHYPHGPLASNHVEGHPGAVDVSDPEGLKKALAHLRISKLKSSMPEDPVHFSGSGH